MLNVQEIPLSKLVPSPANVRRTGRSDGVKQLAASIKAHGLLQNLTVRKGAGDTKGCFEVVAGGRRLAALQRLAKDKHIAANTRVACHVLKDESAEEISLAENVGQCPMHPADQYEAFAKLHTEEGLSAKDIGARFGVSAAVVKERLKLGAVSPKLLKLYREGKLNLDQLTAFTITDDHAAQERVWKELPRFRQDRSAILDALTEGQVAFDDRRARYVGAEAYREAGGTITHDLFDPEGGGYFADAALLNQLVRDKLQRAAKRVLAEGWKWISVEAEFDHDLAAGMRRTHPVLSAEDQAKSEALEAERDALWEIDEPSEDQAERLNAVEAEMSALSEREEYHPDAIASAGAIVSLGHDGQVRIERGFVRPEDAEAKSGGQPETDGDEASDSEPQPRGVSEKLVAELTAARTMALREALGSNPGVAVMALTHALALHAFYHSANCCLEIAGSSAPLHHIDPSLAETPVAASVAARHEAWAKELPDEASTLWDAIAKMAESERLRLLAHCVAVSVNAVEDRKTSKGQTAHADALAKALALDMTRVWKPTAANYFTRVSRERVIEALREVAGPEVPLNILAMKKQPMAEAAEAFMAGKGWLPAALRTD